MRHKWSDIVWLDFETYYSTEFSLKKKAYNTSSYVRDPQFKVHCVAIKDGLKKPSVWYEGKDVRKALKKHGLADRPVCAHNTGFDGFILSELYDIVPPYYYDTLSMARGLHGTMTRNDLDTVGLLYGVGGKKPNVLKKVKGVRNLDDYLLGILGDYCANDNDRCFDISRIQIPVYPNQELDLIDWTIRAFCDPCLYVDQKLAMEEYLAEIERKKEKVEAAEISKDVLNSAEMFAEALRALGVEPPMKLSNTTGEMTYAFAKSDYQFTDMLQWEDRPDVVRLVEARLAIKSSIGETRAKRFIDIGSKKLPMGYNYCAAHTTRWGGANKMNVQNLTRPEYDAKKQLVPGTGRLRRSIIAPPDHVILVGDSGQIEARLNGWFSEQNDLVEVFRQYDADKKNPDPYRVQAHRMYGVALNEINGTQRFVGKICVLGLGYQMGWKRLRATLEAGLMGPPVACSEEEAQNYVNVYRSANDKIVSNWRRCHDIFVDMLNERSGSWKCIEWDGKDKTIWLPNGLGLHYYHLQGIPDEKSGEWGEFAYFERKKVVKTYGGKLTENIMQALGRCVIGEQLLTVDSELKHFKERRSDVCRVVGTTHDEIIAVVPRRHAEKAQVMMLDAMRVTPDWAKGLPLASEGGFDVCYSK